jgi:DNA repair photolyase
LARELGVKGYVPEVLAIGTNTDPYQPVERDRRIMRRLLEVLSVHGHPVTVTTKGTLIERDIDLLAPMAARGLVSVGLSVTTLDAGVARAMEPRVPSPARRLLAIRRLSEAGIPVRIQVSPVVPALTDHELEAILAEGRAAGAQAASMIVLRLPREVAGLFREWLEERFPDRAARVMGRVRELHGGRDYDPDWGTRMTGQGEWARLLLSRFDIARRRLGLGRLPELRRDLFRVPRDPDPQLSLF